MNESHISKRYAKAVLSYAHDLGEEEALYAKMLELAQTCRELPALLQTLDSPVVREEKKCELIISAGGEGELKSYDAFARLIVENHREDLVRSIALAYVRLYRKINNISVINLTSAIRLPEGIRERIRRNVTSRTHGTAEIEIEIDPSIEGGFILQVDDLRLDASVKGQLDKIRRQLTKKDKKIV